MANLDPPQLDSARRIDSRRYSLGPSTVYVDPPGCGKRMRHCILFVNSAMEKGLRESASVSAFILVVVWITFFAGVIDRDCLFIASGVLIGLMLVSTLLKRRQMISELGRMGSRHIRRPFPRGAIVRSGSHMEVTEEDQVLLDRIKSLYVSKLIESSASATRYSPSPDCNACVICLVEYSQDEELLALGCCHTFHASCLRDWFSAQLVGTASQPSCPTCRTQVKLSEQAMETFMVEVCQPQFLGPHLSRRVHIVFDRESEGAVIV